MPRQVLTSEQIASIPDRVRKGATPAELGKLWGVDRGAIHYHLRGGKAARAFQELMGPKPQPWLPHLRAGQQALRKNNRADAAAHFWKAAELLATHT